METKYGFPVVRAHNVFRSLKDLGIRPWPKLETLSLEEYKKRNLTPAQLKEIERFCPKIEVGIFESPVRRPFANFRPVWYSNTGTHVFTLLPDNLIPIAASFRHGAEVISLILPGGMVEEGDTSLAQRAKDEFEAETGIQLAEVTPLTSEEDLGTPLSSQQMPMRACGFWGVPTDPLTINPPRLGDGEFLRTVLIPLQDWLNLIESGQVYEASPIISTFLAIRKMNYRQ
ncbi:MAG: hypothetical protein Q7S43_04800 [bacterium]|nr:hypothetical protein [bacterium]